MASPVDRALAMKAIGRSVRNSFTEGDLDTAWLWEEWLQKLENMTDEEFDERYGITESANII